MPVILDFGTFSCPKCTNVEKNNVTYQEADEARDDCPRIEHLNCSCERCKYTWFMKCSDLDIEQDFGDLDLFTNVCPKCADPQVDMTFCIEGSNAPRRRMSRHSGCPIEEGEDAGKEHLHCSCEVCGYEWSSVTSDWKPAPPKEGEVKVEAPKEAEMGIQPT